MPGPPMPDDGCFLEPHCLSCPQPRCRYDEPRRQEAVLLRQQQAQEMLAHGKSKQDIREALGISQATLRRYTK